jgi:hypothetical protein
MGLRALGAGGDVIGHAGDALDQGTKIGTEIHAIVHPDAAPPTPVYQEVPPYPGTPENPTGDDLGELSNISGEEQKKRDEAAKAQADRVERARADRDAAQEHLASAVTGLEDAAHTEERLRMGTATDARLLGARSETVGAQEEVGQAWTQLVSADQEFRAAQDEQVIAQEIAAGTGEAPTGVVGEQTLYKEALQKVIDLEAP